MAGGVRNLRAMFEQKPTDEAPSPSASSRGRSPAPGDLENRSGSRTGSKVRASFYPVEANKPRNQTPDTNASTSHRRESNPTSTECHAGNKEILDVQEQARQDLDALKAEQDIEVDAQTELTRTPTNQTQESDTASRSVFGNNATLHGILSGSSTETKAEPVGFKPEIQRELSQKLERKASRRQLPTSVPNNSDPFITKPAPDTPKLEDKINGSSNGLASQTATSAATNGKESSIVKAEVAALPPMSDPGFLSPSVGQITENLTNAANSEDSTPTQPSKNLTEEVPKMPRTPTHAPVSKTATPRTGPKLTSTTKISRPEAPESDSVKVSPLAPATHPSPPTNGNNALASPGANDSPVPRTRSTSQGGRTSVGSRHGGTITTGGFVKPRPKSPTRPVRLPAHLVAPTASSAAKHGNTSTQPEKTLARRSSTINNTSNFARSAQGGVVRRPSTKPPTTQQNRRAAVSPANTNPVPRALDDSFLARMMRPTASSASKVRDGAAAKAKEPAGPRTKVAPRPKTNGTASTAVQKSRVEKESSEEAVADPGPGQMESSSFETQPDADPIAGPEADSGVEKNGETVVERVSADNGAN